MILGRHPLTYCHCFILNNHFTITTKDKEQEKRREKKRREKKEGKKKKGGGGGLVGKFLGLSHKNNVIEHICPTLKSLGLRPCDVFAVIAWTEYQYLLRPLCLVPYQYRS